MDKVERFMLQMEPENQLEMTDCSVEGHPQTEVSFLFSRNCHLVVSASRFLGLSSVIYSTHNRECTIKVKKNCFFFNGRNALLFEGKSNFLIFAYNKVG